MKHFVSLALSLIGSTVLLGSHPVKFETQLLAVDANEGVAVADYDKDGKLDVSAGAVIGSAATNCNRGPDAVVKALM